MFRSSDRRPTDESDVSLERLSGRVHVLAERVDSLSQTVATTAAGMAKKDGEIANIRRELESGQTRAEALAAVAGPGAGSDEVRELRERVAALASDRARTSDDGRIAKLDAKVALLTERIDTLGATVATTAAGLAGREGEIAVLRRRLDEGPGALADESVRKRIDDLGAATASTSMRIESHSTQIGALRDALDARQDTLESAMAMLAERVDAAERERAALATSVADAAAARWQELERALASLDERLDAVERDRTASTSELARVTSLWPAALRSLEGRIAEIARTQEHEPQAPTASEEPSQDIQRFLVEIRGLAQRIENADAASRQERDELRARLQRLEAEESLHPEEERLPVGADILQFRGAEP